MQLEELEMRLREFSAVRDWHRFHSPKNLSMALMVEAAELAENFQWLTEEQSQSMSADSVTAVAEEMADVQIYLILLADKLGVDLLDAVDRKIEKNAEKHPPINQSGPNGEGPT